MPLSSTRKCLNHPSSLSRCRTMVNCKVITRQYQTRILCQLHRPHSEKGYVLISQCVPPKSNYGKVKKYYHWPLELCVLISQYRSCGSPRRIHPLVFSSAHMWVVTNLKETVLCLNITRPSLGKQNVYEKEIHSDGIFLAAFSYVVLSKIIMALGKICCLGNVKFAFQTYQLQECNQ